MATKEQIEEVSKEADAVIAAHVAKRSLPVEDMSTEDEMLDKIENLKAAIRELAAIARSHSPMMQFARVGELLALAD